MGGAWQGDWDPFMAADDAYYALVKGDTLAIAADAYAERIL